ncbi:MAG: DUF6787 family protein [Cyclobacteriaceae bacterium]|nr:DUF6787 family protein [Cyclobacteriaceae bacterium]
MNNQEQNQSTISRLKTKWGVNSAVRVILILIVFSLTGMTVVFARPIIFSAFGFNESTSIFVKTITYILLIFPMYQVLILVYGAMLGQFAFFWEKEKKLVKFLSSPFRKSKTRD